MAEMTWEKNPETTDTGGSGRLKFLIGGALMLAAIAYLVISGTAAGARYFITVEELAVNPEYAGQTVRISGAVIGDTIEYDSENLVLDFTIAHIPTEYDDLARVLHEAVINPDAIRLPVHMENEVMPDLLQDEAQAILTGTIGEDGVFHATELLLKCPSRYEEIAPNQTLEDHNEALGN